MEVWQAPGKVGWVSGLEVRFSIWQSHGPIGKLGSVNGLEVRFSIWQAPSPIWLGEWVRGEI